MPALTTAERSKRYRERKIQAIADANNITFAAAKIIHTQQETAKRKARRARRQAEKKEPEKKTKCEDLVEAMPAIKKKTKNINNQVVPIMPNTSKLNMANISRNYSRLFGEDLVCTEENLDKYADYKKVINFVMNEDPKLKKLTSKRKYLESIGSVLKSIPKYEKLGKIYLKEAVIQQKEIEKGSDENKLTPEELKNWTDFDTVINAYKSENLTIPEATLLALYTIIPPRRRSFATYLTVIDKDEKQEPNLNYLVLDGRNPSLLVLNNYKTYKTYGRVEIKLPSPLKRMFRLHLQENELKSGDRVFTTTTGKPYRDSNISNYFKEAFRKSTNNAISFNLLRHIYITHRLKTPRSLRYKKKLAKQMGHSLAMQQSYIRIFEEDEEADEEE